MNAITENRAADDMKKVFLILIDSSAFQGEGGGNDRENCSSQHSFVRELDVLSSMN